LKQAQSPRNRFKSTGLLLCNLNICGAPIRRQSLAGLLIAAVAVLLASPTGVISASATEISVYRGPGCIGRNRIADFENFIGRKVERTVDALNQVSWKEMRSSIPWVTKCWAGSGLKLTLSVPMLPFDKTGTLAEGAAGKFDYIFRETAKQLVAHGFQDAIVRIAWEFNGHWMPWRAAADPQGYVAYFRRIVGIMRAEPGQRFRFEWTPNHTKFQIDPEQVYPGDDVVDVIGMDVYDEIHSPDERDPVQRWTSYVERPVGLRWHVNFARAHHKPFAYSEWGVGQKPQGYGGGDNPVFVAGMLNWFRKTNPLYQNYWDNNSSTYDAELSQGNRYPKASAEFKRLMAAH